MKKIFILLMLIGLAGMTCGAYAQTGDGSDWNVPPPLPPGTIPKGAVPRKIGKATDISPVVDVPQPAMPKLGEVELAALSPVSSIIPAVAVPYQPVFPSLPFETPEIPVPAAPEAMDLPKQVPADEIIGTTTDFPEPQAPDMPATPNTPVTTGKDPVETFKVPLTPGLLQQPVVNDLPGASFPFTEWSVLPIVSNIHFVLVLPDEKGDIRSKPKALKRKQKNAKPK